MARILIVNYEYPPLGGGGGQACAGLAAALAALGHQVFVVSSRFADLPHCEEQSGITIERIPTLRSNRDRCSVPELATFMLSSSLELPRLAKRYAVDGIIAFFSIPCGPAAWLASSLMKIPFVISLRGGDVPGFLPEQLATFHAITSGLTRFLWRRAKAVVANSRGLADLAEVFLPKLKVPIIPNGVESSFFIVRQPRLKSLDPVRLISVNRLSEQKKVQRQLEVMRVLKETHPQMKIRLDIIGDGPQSAMLQEMAVQYQLLGTSVFFQGWQDRKDLPAMLAKADAFIMTSDYEGMPNAVIEALAAGCPVIATDAPGTRDLVLDNQTGILLRSRDPEDMAKAIVELATHSEQQVRLSQGARQMATTLSWRSAATAYVNLLFSL